MQFKTSFCFTKEQNTVGTSPKKTELTCKSSVNSHNIFKVHHRQNKTPIPPKINKTFIKHNHEKLIAIIEKWINKNQKDKENINIINIEEYKNMLQNFEEALNKSTYKAVDEALVYNDGETYWICPNCKTSFEREYQKYCDRCGQKLKWPALNKIKYIPYEIFKERYFQ